MHYCGILLIFCCATSSSKIIFTFITHLNTCLSRTNRLTTFQLEGFFSFFFLIPSKYIKIYSIQFENSCQITSTLLVLAQEYIETLGPWKRVQCWCNMWFDIVHEILFWMETPNQPDSCTPYHSLSLAQHTYICVREWLMAQKLWRVNAMSL